MLEFCVGVITAIILLALERAEIIAHLDTLAAELHIRMAKLEDAVREKI